MKKPVSNSVTKATQSEQNKKKVWDGYQFAIQHLVDNFDRAEQTKHEFDEYNWQTFYQQFPKYHLYFHDDGRVFVNLKVHWAKNKQTGECLYRWGQVFIWDETAKDYIPLLEKSYDKDNELYDEKLVLDQNELFGFDEDDNRENQIEDREEILNQALNS